MFPVNKRYLILFTFPARFFKKLRTGGSRPQWGIYLRIKVLTKVVEEEETEISVGKYLLRT